MNSEVLLTIFWVIMLVAFGSAIGSLLGIYFGKWKP